MGKPYLALLLEVRRELHLENQRLAEFLGTSLRTVERYNHAGGLSDPRHQDKLITALYPVNPGLAREFAASAGKSIVALGLEQPVPTSPPPAAAAATAPPPSRAQVSWG